MHSNDILELIKDGESSKVQFKSDIKNAVQISQELAAFANTKGGVLLVGIDDKTGEVNGLSFQDLQRINNLLSTAASDHVKSPITLTTETVKVDEKRILMVTIPEGIDKPHTDKDGIIWIKNGADKRKVISKEEISRMLQSSGNLYAEELILQHSCMDDLNWDKFKTFYEELYKTECSKEKAVQYLENLRLGSEDKINIAGALLFGKNLQKLTPQFFITAIWFWGNSLTETEYRSSENIYGTIDQLFQKSYDFILSKLNKIQPEGRDFNSLGVPEIPEIVITELLVNALIHRDYFIKDSIKLFVFENRIEIISPGTLPNNLTEEQVRKGIRRTRNTIIASFAPYLMQYRGAGSGILRSLELYPKFTLENDVQNERVVVAIQRPELRKK
jgi:ATP-dependent DNA helicase RecG